MRIAIVGISNKINCTPLDESTNTGKIVNQIISQFPDIEFYKTNLVSFAPLNKDGKLRYPTAEEIKKEMPHLLNNIKNCNFVICLGGKVEAALKGKIDNMIPVKHPSYVWVYKRKEVEAYISDIISKIEHL